MRDKVFWENVSNYDEEIISVFANKKKNLVIEEIKKIKNKKELIVADIGCGTGNSFEYIKDFKKIYAIDFSENMIEKAKKKAEELKLKNIEFSVKDILNENLELSKKCDLILAISSIFPKNNSQFEFAINNLKRNLKKNGIILITTSSLESRIFSFQLHADLLFKNNHNINFIYQTIKEKEFKQNFSSFGYMLTKDNLIQKQWLKEELYFKLKKINFKKIKIKKLELDWELQVKKLEYKKYPNLWLWMIKIEN